MMKLSKINQVVIKKLLLSFQIYELLQKDVILLVHFQWNVQFVNHYRVSIDQ